MPALFSTAQRGAKASSESKQAENEQERHFSDHSLSFPLSSSIPRPSQMLLSRPAALLFFLSSRPWARADGGAGGTPDRELPAEQEEEPEAAGSAAGSSAARPGGLPGVARLLQGPRTVSDAGDTTGAAAPYGLSFCADDSGATTCSVGCPSKFYTVVGTGGSMTASTCEGSDRGLRLIVRQGLTTGPCSALTCVGACLVSLSWLRDAPSRACWLTNTRLCPRVRCRQGTLSPDATTTQRSPGTRLLAPRTTSR
jgi:hypothetical protein